MKDFLDILSIIIMCLNVLGGICFILMCIDESAKDDEEEESKEGNGILTNILIGNTTLSSVLAAVYLVLRLVSTR